MQKRKKYLELAERYRTAKLDTRDRTTRNFLSTLEHSYTMLAQSDLMLTRSRKVEKALANSVLHRLSARR